MCVESVPTISRRWFLLLHGCKKMVCIDDYYSCYTPSLFSTTSFAHAFSLTYLILPPCLTQIMVCSTDDGKDSRYSQYDTFSPLSFLAEFRRENIVFFPSASNLSSCICLRFVNSASTEWR